MKRTKNTKVAGDKCPTIASIPLACSDEYTAVGFMERMRWGDSPACPRCGSLDVYKMVDRKTGDRVKHYRWRCHDCKRQYSVRTGTVFEDSRIPLKIWCYAFWRACSSKKGVSAMQIKRETGLSYKSALFLMHRIRYAMTEDNANPPKLNGVVETDETYVGGKPRYRKTRKAGRGTTKAPVLAMVERGGRVRVKHVPHLNKPSVLREMMANIDPSARLVTDQWTLYTGIGKPFSRHDRIDHSMLEYVRGDVHTNTAEGFFSLLKRGLYGTFHSVSKKHLWRYLGEFEYRYNTRYLGDGERIRLAIGNAIGKRLTYSDQINS